MSITPGYYIHEAFKQVPITTRQELESVPDAAFELATAPDGLPIVMHVERAADVRGAVMSALRHPAMPSRELERAIVDLERAARVHSVALGLVRAANRIFYETAGSVSAFFGDTLLARILGAASPMVLSEDARIAASPERFANTAMLSIADATGAPHPETAPPTAGRDARLWIGIGKDARMLAVTRGASDTPDTMLARARPLVFESLLGVRSARWHVRPRNNATIDHEAPLADTVAYRNALGTAGQLGWSISRHDAATLVAELARSVDREWHARGRVHADLKPGNVLLERTAITAFDALDIATGHACAGVTEGWAAPEQIFVRPVSAATDVFALGLMTAAALSAAVFGEESSVVVPAAGRGRRRLRVIKDADVFVDPELVALPTEARQAWRGVLASCLAFDPVRRPQRGAELAHAIDQLLARWELPGRLAIACGPGSLVYLPPRRDPVWTIDDGR